MAQESGQHSESYSSMLWGSRGWKDIYKVPEYFLEIIDNANKEVNQFISDRHPIRASLWPEYRRFVLLLRLPGQEGPIGGEYDRESSRADLPRGGGGSRRN